MSASLLFLVSVSRASRGEASSQHRPLPEATLRQPQAKSLAAHVTAPLPRIPFAACHVVAGGSCLAPASFVLLATPVRVLFPARPSHSRTLRTCPSFHPISSLTNVLAPPSSSPCWPCHLEARSVLQGCCFRCPFLLSAVLLCCPLPRLRPRCPLRRAAHPQCLSCWQRVCVSVHLCGPNAFRRRVRRILVSCPRAFLGPCSDTRNGPLAVALGWQRCAAACVLLSRLAHATAKWRSSCVTVGESVRCRVVRSGGRWGDEAPPPVAARQSERAPPILQPRLRAPHRQVSTAGCAKARPPLLTVRPLNARARRSSTLVGQQCPPDLPFPSHAARTGQVRFDSISGALLASGTRAKACLSSLPPRRRVRQTHAGSPTACVTWQVRWRRPRRCVRSACPTHQRTLQVSLCDRHRARLSRGPVAHLGAPVLPAAAVGRAPGVRHTRHLKHTPLLERAARARPSRVPEPGGQRWRRAGGSRVSLTQRPCEPPSGVHAVRAAQRRERADPRPAHHPRRSTSCSRAVGAVRLGSGVSGRGRRHG
ncbi:hypothetical protein ERJ75_001112000 [Trypanosoma vivax]|nr:hypothetical protein ERJ75_001112000 [Trypanosoma vivax]